MTSLPDSSDVGLPPGATDRDMDVVGILYHPQKPEAPLLAQDVQKWLQAQELSAWVARGHDGQEEEALLRQKIPGTSLLVVLGGDGSTLRAARLAAEFQVPIFGVNMGRVGFLSEAAIDNWRPRLAQVLKGECWIERRLMLNGTIERDGREREQLMALNDIVVGRGAQARVLRLDMYVDDDLVTTYTADALIVATPTGSTAYAMAAGGPLLPPQLPNFLAVPVAPHLSLDRAVILHEEAIVAIQVQMEYEAMVAADGQTTLSLDGRDRVVISKHDEHTNFVRVGRPSYFYHRLMERLGFWHPKALE